MESRANTRAFARRLLTIAVQLACPLEGDRSRRSYSSGGAVGARFQSAHGSAQAASTRVGVATGKACLPTPEMPMCSAPRNGQPRRHDALLARRGLVAGAHVMTHQGGVARPRHTLFAHANLVGASGNRARLAPDGGHGGPDELARQGVDPPRRARQVRLLVSVPVLRAPRSRAQSTAGRRAARARRARRRRPPPIRARR